MTFKITSKRYLHVASALILHSTSISMAINFERRPPKKKEKCYVNINNGSQVVNRASQIEAINPNPSPGGHSSPSGSTNACVLGWCAPTWEGVHVWLRMHKTLMGGKKRLTGVFSLPSRFFFVAPPRHSNAGQWINNRKGSKVWSLCEPNSSTDRNEPRGAVNELCV